MTNVETTSQPQEPKGRTPVYWLFLAFRTLAVVAGAVGFTICAVAIYQGWEIAPQAREYLPIYGMLFWVGVALNCFCMGDAALHLLKGVPLVIGFFGSLACVASLTNGETNHWLGLTLLPYFLVPALFGLFCSMMFQVLSRPL